MIAFQTISSIDYDLYLYMVILIFQHINSLVTTGLSGFFSWDYIMFDHTNL